jgi:transcriptional regulator with XRE-family HTH domain
MYALYCKRRSILPKGSSHVRNELAQMLHQARSAKKLTLRDVEKATAISNAYLSQLETGKIATPSPHFLQKLAELYGISYDLVMVSAGYTSPSAVQRDLFLSHRSTDKQFVRTLVGDLEGERFQGRNLKAWLDEAEIRPGDSVPKMINEGLEKSRFIAIAMTPGYFQSESGWTDAEWHGALHADPDNRGGRLIPLLVNDCPYIPYLLRHLRAIDFRGNRYEEGLHELLAVLKGDPLPRPVTHRGQLIAGGTHIDRATLVAERAVPDADPDVITEKLYCNLLPIEQLPRHMYSARIHADLIRTKVDGGKTIPSKQRLKDVIRDDQEAQGIEPAKRFTPAFRILGDRVLSLHDLEDAESPLSTVIDENDVEVFDIRTFAAEEDSRNILLSLLNMALERHLYRAGLSVDRGKRFRYFFPSIDGGPNEVTWTPFRKRSVRTVAKPVVRDGKLIYWRHLGAYLQIIFIVNKFYTQIVPTWVITHDGQTPSGGPLISKRVAKWTGPERNLQVLYHIRFWTSVLRANRRGPISVWAGDQNLEIATVPASIQQSYGIARDQRPLMKLLDEEAPLIAAEEDELADMALEIEIPEEDVEDDEVVVDDQNEAEDATENDK